MTGSSKGGAARYPVGLEEGPDGWTHVHALSVPGCVARGGDRDAALDAFQSVLAAWMDFLEGVGEPVPPRTVELEIAVEEWIVTDARVSRGETNVCFEADREPLGDSDVRRGLKLLGDLRGRLLPKIRRARDEDLAAAAAGGYDARTILDELARAQWHTLTRLGASPLAAVPPRVIGRLDTAMALAVQQLTSLPPDARDRTLVLEDEEWTPRKVLRHLLWLEWELGGAALRALSGPPGLNG